MNQMSYEKRVTTLFNELKLQQSNQNSQVTSSEINPASIKNEASVGTSKIDLRQREFNDLQLQTTCCSALGIKIKQLRDENEALRARKQNSDTENESLKTEIARLKKKYQAERRDSFTIGNYTTDGSADGADFISFSKKSFQKISNGTLSEVKKKFTATEKRSNHELFMAESDTSALILEIADRHDQIISLRVKCRRLEERLEQLELKMKFRERIIRELRRSRCPQNEDC